MNLCINWSNCKAQRINKGLFNELLIKFYGIRYYSSMQERCEQEQWFIYLKRYESKNACIIKREFFLYNILGVKKKNRKEDMRLSICFLYAMR